MAASTANGITVEYQTSGDPSDPPLLLIMGLGAQLIAWDEKFVAALATRGFYVLRFDNRDAGLSTWFDDAGVPDVLEVFSGNAPPPYLLADMADDAAGLLAALGIDAAHVLGVSMGGMIAQSLLIAHPQRVASVVSVMATTGDPSVGAPHPEAVTAILEAPPTDRESAMEASVRVAKVIGSPQFAFDEERIRAAAAASFDRAFHPQGTARQAAAIIAAPDRTPGLRQTRRPALVIHGEDDPLVDPSGGRATAAAIPGSSLWMIPGMGHDLPPELFDDIARRVAAHCLGP